METNEKSIFSFGFDETSRTHLRSISFWLLLNALAGLASAALLVIQFIIYSQQGSYRRGNPLLFIAGGSRDNPGTFILQVALTLLLNGMLYFAYRHFSAGLAKEDNTALAKGWNTLRWYYRVYGILLTVFILLGILMIIFISSFSRA